MKTITVKKGQIQRNWFIVDAEGLVLGRLATKIATVLRGKHKPTYSPHLDTGDYVVVINAKKIKLTGKKEETKKYYSYSGYPGGIKIVEYKNMIAKFPERVIEEAVRGMLPHTKLGRKMIKKMKVYAGPEHSNVAQLPKTLGL